MRRGRRAFSKPGPEAVDIRVLKVFKYGQCLLPAVFGRRGIADGLVNVAEAVERPGA